MAFTENVLACTKRIEKLLADLGGSGNGMMEKARSLPILPGYLISDLLRIAWVRNRLVHDHDFRFSGDEQTFFGLCERVEADLCRFLSKADSSTRNQATSPEPPPTSRVSVEQSAGAFVPPKASPSASGIHSSQHSPTPKPSIPQGTSAVSGAHPKIRVRPWMVAIATTILCMIILPIVCVRTVEKGIWPFKSTNQETVWWLVLTLTILAAGGSFLVARRRIFKPR